LLGITRLIVVNGQMHIQVFMLRPTFYNSDVPERALGQVFLHELGHALGLFCHSDSTQDIMAACDGSQSKGFSKNPTISARDTNTLKRLYQSAVLDSDLTLSAPIEWGYSGN
jgi:predicted Zn-dependent protease